MLLQKIGHYQMKEIINKLGRKMKELLYLSMSTVYAIDIFLTVYLIIIERISLLLDLLLTSCRPSPSTIATVRIVCPPDFE